MAKGREAHDERVAHLNSFGKELARRAKSKCELCEVAGEKLAVVEIPPAPRDPSLERCVMLCDACREAVENPKKFKSGDQWRCLAQTVWSEVPAVQALALRLLTRQENSQVWARETLESAFPDEDVAALAAEAE